MLPDQAIKEFQEIYQKEIRTKISLSQAKHKAENFIQLFDIITQPIKKQKKDEND